MILPQSFLGALIVMILGMCCLGLWANFLKLAGRGLRFELFYFDFAIGAGLAALIYGFTVGNLGFDGFSLLDDLTKAGKRQWMFALLAGVVFNLANMLLTAAISVAGMSIAFPLAFGIALIATMLIGQGTTNTLLLIAGCALILLAMVIAALAFIQLAKSRRAAAPLKPGGKGKRVQSPGAVKGIVLAVVSGALMILVPPLLHSAKITDVGLGPYSTMVLFAAGLFLSTFMFNLFFMNLPVQGEPLEVVDYVKARPRLHLLGWVGGAVWCTGFLAILVASSIDPALQAGPAGNLALSYGGALIAALCGLVIWRDFRDAPGRAKTLALGTVLLFAGGLALLARALEV